MTTMHALLAFAVVVAVGLTALVVGELRWEARNRLPRSTTCGQQHHRHAAHR
ncbi:hypothetical protein MUU72_29865 [Streptomyces sp. RS10V-4]|uniref:hypothetical protein n=1 Tax=Streptomyces rhizoryzae TaxID=2932493 RepID=UPI0020034E4B|nr:hypothetical protein [Streptomyces rhizoryzae]MCK7627254.1 hypothetical protein [Streptomyces rhizoryzae]